MTSEGRDHRRGAWAAILTVGLWLGGCDTGARPEEQNGPVRHTEPLPCGAPEDFPPQGTAGQRVDDAFQPYATGDPVQLQYGSQAGMGLAVVVELNDLDLTEVDRIEVDLLVDDEPLGTFGEDQPRLTCQDGFSYFEAMVMLDVVQHPTVASAAQLDQRPAVVELRVFSETDLLIEEAFDVTLLL